MKRKKMEIGQSLGHILSANRVSAKGNDDIYENTQLAKWIKFNSHVLESYF